MLERLRLLLIKLALSGAVLTLLVIGLVLLSVELYLLLNWNFAEIVEVVGTGNMAIPLYVTLGVSVALVLFSFTGLCGICRQSQCCLSGFAFFLLLAMICMLTLSAFFFAYGEVIDEHGEKEMMDTLTQFYKGESSTSAYSLAWNIIQYKLECCGVVNYTDWLQSEWYEGDPKVQDVDQQWPFTCCKLDKSDISDKDVVDGKLNENSIAAADVNDCYLLDNSGLYTSGCKDELLGLLNKSLYISAGVAIGSILIMLGLLWMTCQLIQQDPKDDQKKVCSDDNNDCTAD